MFSTFITAALFVSLAIRGASAGFAISTPKFIQCQPVQVSWAPATPPYQIEIVPADDPCGDALDVVSGLSSTILDYPAALAAGTEVVLYISDSAGNDAWSGNVTIGSSSNNSCIPGVSSIAIPSNVSTLVTHATSTSVPSSSVNSLGGAINAEPNAGGALSVRQASTPLLSITALAAILALAL